MQGFIFNTPFYTKTDWHSGKLILSRNGQTKGYGTPGTMKFDRRVSAARAMHGAAGVTGTTSFRGKKIGNNAIKVMQSPEMNQSFGGAQKKKEMRRAKIQATERRLTSVSGYGGSRGGGMPAPGYEEYGGY